MTNYNFSIFLEKVESVGGTFKERIKEYVLPKSNTDNLIITSNNLVLEKDKNGGFTPHGCPVCLGIAPGQTKDGIPAFGEHQCLDAWQNGLNDSQLPREAMLNLWFCPNCRVPLIKNMPKFE
jgi:hypothetical protein